MIEPEPSVSSEDIRGQIGLQLVVGIIGIAVSIASAVTWAFYMAFSGWGEYWDTSTLLRFLGDITGVVGGAFILAGTVGILMRNDSEFAWIPVATYSIGWIWRCVYPWVIFPGVLSIQGIDQNAVLNVVNSVYTYSILLIMLFAWWSIHRTVSSRPVYYAYLVVYALQGIAGYLLTGLLVGFEGVSVHSPAERFLYLAPSLAFRLLTFGVLLLFMVTQLLELRKGRVLVESMDSWE
ncbi:hypothetical protein EU545_04870, partial [Candidatus Thorarchaeota archaeon]